MSDGSGTTERPESPESLGAGVQFQTFHYISQPLVPMWHGQEFGVTTYTSNLPAAKVELAWEDKSYELMLVDPNIDHKRLIAILERLVTKGHLPSDIDLAAAVGQVYESLQRKVVSLENPVMISHEKAAELIASGHAVYALTDEILPFVEENIATGGDEVKDEDSSQTKSYGAVWYVVTPEVAQAADVSALEMAPWSARDIKAFPMSNTGDSTLPEASFGNRAKLLEPAYKFATSSAEKKLEIAPDFFKAVIRELENRLYQAGSIAEKLAFPFQLPDYWIDMFLAYLVESRGKQMRVSHNLATGQTDRMVDSLYFKNKIRDIAVFCFRQSVSAELNETYNDGVEPAMSGYFSGIEITDGDLQSFWNVRKVGKKMTVQEEDETGRDFISSWVEGHLGKYYEKQEEN